MSLSLKESLQCPVCSQVPKAAPIYQCPSGHLVCSTCHAKLKTCPQCRKKLGSFRNLLAEQLLESSTEPCAHVKLGCLDRLSLGRAEAHSRECKFREVSCPVPQCNQKLPIG